MAIRIEILEQENWWKINHPINEVNETSEEFDKRQMYIYEKLKKNDYLFSNSNDIEEYNQKYNESYIDYVIRFNDRYSYHLDAYNFVPDYYQIVFDYYKQPHILLITDDEIPEGYHYNINL